MQEDQNSHTGYAMPEFPGYTGPASDQCRLIKVKAVTHRRNPIMQTCIGPSEEHVSMAGIPTEASIYGMVEKAMPGRLQNVYCGSAGGGKYMAVLQFKKLGPSDEGRQRQAALLAFSAFSELKHVFLVDEDVDCFDMNDVLWAMNTRFQGDADIITIQVSGVIRSIRQTIRRVRHRSAITELHARQFLTVPCRMIRRKDLCGRGFWKLIRNTGWTRNKSMFCKKNVILCSKKYILSKKGE